MHALRYALILAGWVTAGLLAGGAVSFVLPRSYVSNAELVIETLALSPEGLAQFDEVRIENTMQLLIVSELLRSDAATHYAAATLGRYSAEEIEERVKTAYKENSPIIKLKVRSASASEAQTIARALIEKAVVLSGERDEKRIVRAIESVNEQLADTQRQLSAINEKIRGFNVERGIALSSDRERQQGTAMELADYEQRLAALKVEEAALRNRQQRIQELTTGGADGKPALATLDLGEIEKSPVIAEARRRLLEQEAALASLESRYGRNHARVLAAKAEAGATRETLRAMIGTQHRQAVTLLADNTDAQKIVQGKIAATEGRARETDLTLDPVFAELSARRDALRLSYNLLASRVSELKVYLQAKSPAFYALSAPSLPSRAAIAPLATSVALGAVLAGIIGLIHISRAHSLSARRETAARGASYATG